VKAIITATLIFAASPAYAESALEFVTAGMGRGGAIMQPLRLIGLAAWDKLPNGR
jgi:hypothetical protein